MWALDHAESAEASERVATRAAVREAVLAEIVQARHFDRSPVGNNALATRITTAVIECVDERLDELRAELRGANVASTLLASATFVLGAVVGWLLYQIG